MLYGLFKCIFLCTYKSYSNLYVPGDQKAIIIYSIKKWVEGRGVFNFEKVGFLLENKFKKTRSYRGSFVFETILIFIMGAFFSLKRGSGYK